MKYCDAKLIGDPPQFDQGTLDPTTNRDIVRGSCTTFTRPYEADKEYKPLIYKSSGLFLELKSEHLMTRYLG